MSIDHEIDNIRQGLADIAKTLAYLDNSTESALDNLQRMLFKLEDKMYDAVDSFAEMTRQINDISKEFPHAYIYYSLFVLTMLILWLLIIYMAFTVHSTYSDVKLLLATSPLFGRKYEPVEQTDSELFVMEDGSPPPSYSSSSQRRQSDNDYTTIKMISDH